MRQKTGTKVEIARLESIIRTLIREKVQWEGRALAMERTQAARALPEALAHDEREFLDQVGSLVRPFIHEVGGRLDEVGRSIAIALRADRNTESADALARACETIEYLRRRLTDLSYLGGKTAGQFSLVDVNTLVKENARFLKNLYGDAIVDLELYDGPLELLGDREALNQILANLMINGYEAAYPSDQRIVVTTDLHRQAGSSVRITVRDTGVGITEEQMKLIYDLHYTTKKFGYGIGLYLVKNAVDMHQGTISCESDPSKGTCFTVTLPTKPNGAIE